MNETDYKNSQYDMIIERDILTELGINLFAEGIMTWDNKYPCTTLTGLMHITSKPLSKADDKRYFLLIPIPRIVKEYKRYSVIKYSKADLK